MRPFSAAAPQPPQPRGRARLPAAGLAAVLGLGLLPSATSATAATTADGPAADAPAGAGPAASGGEQAALPSITPRPQSVQRRGDGVPLPARARVVAADGTDRAARAAVTAALRAADVEVETAPAGATEAAPSGAAGTPVLTVYVGGPQQGAASVRALRELGAKSPSGLPSGGYVLASGKAASAPDTAVVGDSVRGSARVVLSGADADGTYYAAQTFRQLLESARAEGGRPARAEGGDDAPVLPALTVRDWPRMQWRGAIEGFYGDPWTQRDRLRQLDFYGAHKMNTYVYAPKDDPYHREKWREPYPADRLDDLRALNRRAQARHVDMVYSISPGLDVCYSDPDDLAALRAKSEAVWDLGVRTFGLFFDDIAGELNCARDKERFGDDADPLAAAQAHLLNAYQKEFLDAREGAGRLLTVPTEYSGTDTSTYRERFAELTHDDVVMYWTGPEVVSDTITDADADAAADVFRHDLILWDNYPVNDYLPRQLYLGPLAGRSPELTRHGIVGLTANPMPQAEPSKIALSTVGDYAWNPGGYRSEPSWRAALRDVGGQAHEALRAFAGNTRSSDLDPTESPRLAALIEDFWTERRKGGGAASAAGTRESGGAAEALVAEFTAMERAQGELTRHMGNPSFTRQAKPWLTKLHRYGAAGAAATRALAAQTDGDAGRAWREWTASVKAAESADEVYESMTNGVVPRFLADATKAQRVVTAQGPERAPAESDVPLTARVRSGDVAVDRVEFHAGPRKLGADTTAPYELTWKSAPVGRHMVTARAVADDGSTVTSAASPLTVGDPSPVLLLVGDDVPVPEGEELSAGDAAVRDRLEYLGHPVVVAQGEDTGPEDAKGKAGVVISSSLPSSAVEEKFRDAAVPVVTWEAQILDDMGMASEPGETFRVSRLRIADPESPLAAGLDGDVDVYRGEDRIRWGTPARTAETAAVTADEDEYATVFGYRKGDRMVDTTAPAARVALFLGDDAIAPGVTTDEGLRLFDAAVRWAL
ncbi:hypothetical protein DVA86_01050 [Streptomyces armeniacus]|uniref:GH84 domain-containing protein n=1 Tax=Streptomyces armeniacus TaxID=83291 RepID=A0A345XIH4_9ACTN|nr:beta-N-acetylglucosaminidase domain-containing protein [Streptomyces armeniacus]AXK31440.1 hypothetical protein DVA86_01050 [Streptomyces armeniacus]